MITEYDQKRIRDDAYIAADALHSLMYAPDLSEHYVNEKVKTVEACLKFIKNFTKVKNEKNN